MDIAPSAELVLAVLFGSGGGNFCDIVSRMLLLQRWSELR